LDGVSALAAAGAVPADATMVSVPSDAALAEATVAASLSVATVVPSRGVSGLSKDVHALAGKAGRLFSLPENLVRAIVTVESGGRTNAVSDKGAVGLMQLMPGTAKEMGVKDPLNAWDNLVGGAKYLARQLERFGRLDHALAAYNAGPGAVEKHAGVPPFAETRDYVRRVLQAKARLDRANPAGA
jgi:soluble lytic murein transglycosylase-like protein